MSRGPVNYPLRVEVRLTPSQRAHIEAQARTVGLTASQYVREAAVSAVAAADDVRLRRAIAKATRSIRAALRHDSRDAILVALDELENVA